MKKVVSMLLASALAVSAMAPVMAKDTFKDVPNGHWAKEYVEDMAERGLISGFDDNTYRPNEDVSRRDAFALFARLMGSNSDANEEVLELAKEKYKDTLKKYDLTYAEGDIAFLMYRGIVTKADLDKYFKDDKKTEAMPRYEAAVLITKAMLAEDEATDEVLIDMDYTDAKDIPADAKQYVYYVTQKGIMNGVGDGKFAPNTEVQRGQIAVMLSKTANSKNYYFELAKLEKVDIELDNIKIADYKDEIGYSKNTVIYKDGEKVGDEQLLPGQKVVLTYSEDDAGAVISFIDILETEITESADTIYKGFTSVSGTLKVTGEDPITGETTQYRCSPNAVITVDGKLTDINKVKAGAYVTLGIAGETVIEITTMEKTKTIKDAVLTTVDPKGRIVISHEDKEYDGTMFDLGKNTRITKDGSDAEFTDLYRGDKLTLKLEYGVLSQITATASRKTVTGILKSYTISQSPTLIINVNGENKEYIIPAEIKVMVNGKEGKLSDYEIGSSVTLTLESDAIIKVDAASIAATPAGVKLSGEVISVNSSAKVVMIKYNEAGTEQTTYITCTEYTKYITMPTFGDYTLKKIKAGDFVEAYGAYQNGIFICKGMTVVPAN